MFFVPITSTIAGIFAIALVCLSIPVTARRLKVGEFIGQSADGTLQRRIRAQGNFAEYVPLGVVTLGLIEAHAAPAWMVMAIGGSLMVGRILHAAGMHGDSAPLRGFGIIFTYLSLTAAGVRLLSEAWRWV